MLTEDSSFNDLHQKLRTDIGALKSTVEMLLKDLYPVNDLNNNGKKDTEDITFAEQKVNDAKNKKITLLSEINMLTSKPEITKEEYTQLVNMHEEFKKSIEDGRNAIDAIPQSDAMSLLGETYNVKRNNLERDLPQDDVQLPAAPSVKTSKLQAMVNEYEAAKQSFKYYNSPDDLKSKYDSAIVEGRQILENPNPHSKQ